MPKVVFPLGPEDDGYQDLLQAAKAIERVAERYHSRAVQGKVALRGGGWLRGSLGLDETDTAYIGRLDAAAMVVRSCLKEV